MSKPGGAVAVVMLSVQHQACNFTTAQMIDHLSRATFPLNGGGVFIYQQAGADGATETNVHLCRIFWEVSEYIND